MWDDEINKRIKEAAGQYHPGYNEKAWDKMEQMLDEHLPQKRKKRRIIYYFLLAILLGTGSYFVFHTTHKNKSLQASSTLLPKNKGASDKDKINSQPIKGGITGPDGKKQSDAKNVHKEVAVASSSSVNKQKTGNLISEDNERNDVKLFEKKNGNDNAGDNEFIKNKTTVTDIKQNNQQIGEENKTQKENINPPSLKDTQTVSIIDNSIDSSKSPVGKNTEVAQKSLIKKKAKTRQDFAQKFGISFSAGPDISGVDLKEAGKTTLSYGAGLRYFLSDKIALRAGFYVSKKIYSAEKKYYTPSGSSSADYYYLQSVDANCNVYEIPLTVSYYFSKLKNHSWFVSTGLSSYLMKKESYTYYYKYPSGNTDDKSWSVSNKNKHYFSVLDISGGYEYRVNKKLTLSAEPYLKLPLTGIGEGKIKLKSGGILFSVTLHP